MIQTIKDIVVGKVDNIDKTKPKPGTITARPSATSVELSMTATDGESGVAEVVWEYKKSDNSGPWQQQTTKVHNNNTPTSDKGPTSQDVTTTINELQEDAGYTFRAKVIDVAGNESSESSPEITTKTLVSNHTPVLGEMTVTNKTTSSLTISTSATDEDGDLLTYELYVSETNSFSGSPSNTLDRRAPGSNVNLTATGLKEYTKYYYKVVVRDTKSGEVSGTSEEPTKTKCSGVGSVCGLCKRYRFSEPLRKDLSQWVHHGGLLNMPGT